MSDSTVPPLRWAVVGIGRHSRQYVVPAVARSASGVLAALVSRDPVGAAAFAEPFGAPRVHSRYEHALADPDVDAVFLATPNDLHRDQVLAAAAAGKHVLCEKPLALTAADAAAMVAACDRAGVALGVGFHLRHNEVHRQARDLVRDGAIGALRFIEVRYAHRSAPRDGAAPAAGIPPVAAWRRDPAIAGGGAFVSTGGHAVDLIRYLTGEEFLDVQGRADAGSPAETNLVATGGLSGGAIAVVQAGDLAYPANETVLSGTEGTLICRGSVGNAGTGTLTLESAAGERTWSPEPHDVYVRELDAFAAAVRNHVAPDASGADGLACLQVIEAVYRAAGDRITVQLSDPS